MISQFPFMKTKLPIPYVSMEYDQDRQIISRFFDAVRANSEDAWAFVSHIYSSNLDLQELRELLDSGVQHVKMVTYVNVSKHCQTRSVYVNDKKRKVRKLLHIHMVKQPDHNGKWKIFRVEQEECARI